MLKRFAVLASCLPIALATLALAQTHNSPNFDGKSWWDHVKVLASDDMEGRETGSAGLRKASAYVVGRFLSAGTVRQPTD